MYPSQNSADDSFGTAKQIRRHYGDRSDMWIWRLLRDDPMFPRPLVINGRRYWRWSDLQAWERSKASGAA